MADDNFQLIKSNPRHPSLYFKNVGRFWIGSHADYDRLVN